MKKFIVFQYSQYYPLGGMDDLKDSFDTMEEAEQFIKKNIYDFNEIVDRDTWEELKFS